MTVESTESPDWLPMLTQIALVIVLAVCATRVTMSETLRDTFMLSGMSGADDVGAQPGPTTTLLLDLLCWAPVLLILIRRAIDPTYVLRWQASHVILLLLSAWVCLSTFWANDRFAACINASTWCAGGAIVWATSQLVRSWTRLRFVLAIAVGFLAIFLAQSVIYKFLELPETQAQFKLDRDKIYEANHWSPDDFAAKQFDLKVKNGELIGFYKSPNTLAAIATLCAFITAGFALQRWIDGDSVGLIISLGVPVILTPLMLWGTGSRTAMAGAVICAIFLAIAWWFRATLAARSKTFFAVACAFALLGAAGVITLGIKTGGLIHDSLNFRWNYWLASWRLMLYHPWRGVGWSNFGDAYLGFRLPVATEEIKDPHNFIVKFLVETGIIGAVLAIVWMARSFREMTTPIEPRRTTAGGAMLGLLAAVIISFAILHIAATSPLSFLVTEILKLLLFSALLLMGVVVAAVRGKADRAADDRPAPLLLYATIVGFGGFVLHNLVDFAMFENGPWMVMMLVLGAVLGARHASVAGRKSHTWAALGGLAILFIGLLACVALLIVPVATAEAKANEADEAGRAGRLTDALAYYREAIAASPVPNYDYADRAVRWMQDSPPSDVMAMLTAAITADPANPGTWLERARFRRQIGDPSSAVIIDYTAVLARNPQDIQTRLEFGDYLDSINQHAAADEQYRLALRTNDQYHADEPRRLPAARVDALRQRLKQ